MLAFESPGGVSFAYAALSQIQGSLYPLLQAGLKPTFFCQICLSIFISHLASTADGEEKLFFFLQKFCSLEN